MLRRHGFFGLCIFAVLLLSGCGSVSLSKFTDSTEAFLATSGLKCKKAANAIMTISATGTLSSESYIVPRSSRKDVDILSTISTKRSLARSKVMEKLAKLSKIVSDRVQEDQKVAGVLSLKPSQDLDKITSMKITPSEFRNFVEVFGEEPLSLATYTENVVKGTQDTPSLGWLFKKYFEYYLDDKFVDRNGKKWVLPKIKSKIPNDVIVVPLAIFLEAFFDLELNMPIIVEGDGANRVYYPAGNKEKPTADTIEYNGKKLIPILKIVDDDSNCGITKREAKAIGFVSNLAASKSATLAGLVLETFGDIEVAFVVGGNFSIGDNETLAVLVKTLFEVSSRRLTERAAYEVLYVYSLAWPSVAELQGPDTALKVTRRKIEAFLVDFDQ